MDRVDQLDPGDDRGVGRRQHLVFTTRLPYRLGFDIRVRRVEPPSLLEADATGELEGVGRWTLAPDDGGTLVRYTWDVRTTRWWMSLAAPVARPAFIWNHDALMREGGRGLARWLGAAPVAPPAQRRPGRRASMAGWAGLAAASVVAAALWWRRRGARWPRERGHDAPPSLSPRQDLEGGP